MRDFGDGIAHKVKKKSRFPHGKLKKKKKKQKTKNKEMNK